MSLILLPRSRNRSSAGIGRSISTASPKRRARKSTTNSFGLLMMVWNAAPAVTDTCTIDSPGITEANESVTPRAGSATPSTLYGDEPTSPDHDLSSALSTFRSLTVQIPLNTGSATLIAAEVSTRRAAITSADSGLASHSATRYQSVTLVFTLRQGPIEAQASRIVSVQTTKTPSLPTHSPRRSSGARSATFVLSASQSTSRDFARSTNASKLGPDVLRVTGSPKSTEEKSTDTEFGATRRV